MRKTRKFFAILLAMVMAMSVLCLTAFAGEKKQYTAYTFFGDSVTAGAGLASYYTFYSYNPETGKIEGTAEGERVLGTYADLVAKEVGIDNGKENYYNESHSGWRSSEVREVLDEEYYNDDGAVAYALSAAMANGKTIATPSELRDQVRSELAQSDLISLALGSNDVQLPIIMTLYSVINPTASEDYKAWKIEQLLQKYGSSNEVILQLAQTLTTLHGIEFALEQISKATLTGLNKFRENYPAIIEKIREINPTADIYVIGIYNPMRDTQISEELPIKIGKIIDPMIMAMNLYLSQLSPARCEYTYVDAFDTATIDTVNVTDLMGDGGLSAAGMGEYTLAVHPSEEGHAYIAQQFLNAIPDKPAVLNGIVKGEDGLWAMYRNNKVVNYTGVAQNEKGWWRVENGYVDFEANGIYQNAFGWWKTTNGKVTFKETGIFENENGKWYVRNSKVDFTKYGRVKYDGKYYTVIGGKVRA